LLPICYQISDDVPEKCVEVDFTRIGDFTWRESDCEELVGSITGENGAEILISAFRSRRSISGREMDG